MIQQGDILRCKDGNVSFKYRDARTGKMGVRTLGGANFLRLVLQNVLPKGLRRARNFGFLHPTACGRFACGEPMHVVHRRVAALQSEDRPNAQPSCVNLPDKPDAGAGPHDALKKPSSPSATGCKPARCVGSPENRSCPSRAPGIDTRQPPASAFSTLAGIPSTVLAAGPFGSICSGLEHLRAACPGLVQQSIRSRLRAIYPQSLEILAEKPGGFTRNASDLVCGLAIKLEVQLGLRSVVVPVLKLPKLSASQLTLRERSAIDGNAHARCLPGDANHSWSRLDRGYDASGNQA